MSNARLVQLRSLVPVSNANIGIDLADNKQMVVVCDHDSKCHGDVVDALDRRPSSRRKQRSCRTVAAGRPSSFAATARSPAAP